MSRLINMVFVFALSISFILPITAQDVRGRKEPGRALADPDERIPPNHRRALSMLDRILQSSAGFEDIALKLKIQAEAAEMLWHYDEPRARKLYEVSFQAIDTIQASSDEKIANQYLAGFKGRLRSDILKAVSQHDRDFAESLAKSAANEGPATGKAAPRCVGCGVQIESVMQTLHLALNAAQTDPQRAVQLAKEALSGGINSLIYSVLLALRRREPAIADELFSYVIIARGIKQRIFPTALTFWRRTSFQILAPARSGFRPSPHPPKSSRNLSNSTSPSLPISRRKKR